MRPTLFLLLATTALPTPRAAAADAGPPWASGAKVAETTVRTAYYADAVAGSDTNSGVATDQAVRSLAKLLEIASAQNAKGVTTYATLRPGTYTAIRQQPGRGRKGVPMILVAETNGTVVIESAEVPGDEGSGMKPGNGRPALVRIANRSDLIVRGITFRGSPSAKGAAVVGIDRVDNILFESCRFESGSGAGLAISNCTRVTVSGGGATDNAGPGLVVLDGLNVMVERFEVSRNGWGAADASGLDGAGVIFRGGGTNSLRSVVVSGNRGLGVALTDEARVARMKDVDIRANGGCGLLLDRIAGPLLVLGSTIAGNGSNGVRSVYSEQVRIEGSRLFHNSGSELFFAGSGGPQDGPVVVVAPGAPRRWVFLDNAVASAEGGVPVATDLSPPEWRYLVSILGAQRNRYASATEDHIIFSIAHPATNYTLNFDDWRRRTMQDLNSKLVTAADLGL